MPDFCKSFKQDVFVPFVEECSRVFEYFYPAVKAEKNGFTEAPLTSFFMTSIRKSGGPLSEAVWWDEFPLPNDARFANVPGKASSSKKKNSNHLDALMLEPTSGAIILVEAKNGMNDFANYQSVGNDIVRMINVAGWWGLSQHIWSGNHTQKESRQAFGKRSFYGLNLFWVWSSSKEDEKAVKKNICDKLAHLVNGFNFDSNSLYLDKVLVRHPSLSDLSCWVCAYLWRIDRKLDFDSLTIVENSALSEHTITSLMHALNSQVVMNECSEKPRLNKYDIHVFLNSKLYVWIRRCSYNIGGDNNQICVVVGVDLRKGLSISNVGNEWTQTNTFDSTNYKNNYFIAVGSIHDLETKTGIETVTRNVVAALRSIKEFTVS